MKHFIYSLFALLLCVAVGCETDAPVEEPQNKPDDTPQEELSTPSITLAKGDATATTLTFTATIKDAKEAAYVVLEDGAELPTLEDIITAGEALDVTSEDAQSVTVEGLTPATDYTIVAAAKNDAETVGSNTIYMATVELGTLTLEVEIVQKDHEKMHFRVKAENAEKIAYVVMPATMKAPEMEYVLQSGEEISVDSRESVEVTDLEVDTEYQLLVAAEGNEQAIMHEAVLFKTDDDPNKVISHEYTRARGTKYGSSYFMMFSYPDANEADNFAYNEKTLSLDIYADPEKDYLPAGTYEVKETTDPGYVSAYRYSTYGYDNGVQLSSGRVIVAIDPDTKAYSFDIDLYLKDGRHLIATYNGDVDNMPVIDIITVTTTFTKASATTSDDGANWTLELADDAGNEAKFDLTNAFKAAYIVNNSYTISTSAEEFATRAVEAGQFDGATSTFLVAGEAEAMTFASGTLHVDIDWATERYLMAFYGTLGNNYIIEAEYEGTIEGISLKQSEDIFDVVLDKATARSYEDNANWYLTFTQTVEGVEAYRLVLDAYCPVSEYLPAGFYSTTSVEDGRSISLDGSSLYVAGEGQYSAVEVRANVNIDMAAKTYSFDMTFKVADGRTFKLAYTGAVDGMEVTEPEEAPDAVNWTTFKAKNWYSDNWQLAISDADGLYNIAFDIRTGDSSLNYIPSGVYTLGATGQYIDSYYSTFNGSKNAFKAATLTLTYHEDTNTYDLEFDVTLNDDRNFTGSYSGAIEGTPKA